jgi:hypothetical protein
MTKIDAHSTSFWASTQSVDNGGAHLGILERQRVKTWLKNAYDEIGHVNP